MKKVHEAALVFADGLIKYKTSQTCKTSFTQLHWGRQKPKSAKLFDWAKSAKIFHQTLTNTAVASP
jgi:hypothetical protein